MGLLDNDLAQGIKNISEVSKILGIPPKTILTAKIIFHYVYPSIHSVESLTDVSFISLFVSTKIEETHIKIECFINAINSLKSCKLNRSSFIKCESKIISALNFQFEIKHVSFLVLRFMKLLGKTEIVGDYSDLERIHDSSRVNLIRYFGSGKYDPEMVAIAYFNEAEVKEIENELFIEVDRCLLKQIQEEVYRGED